MVVLYHTITAVSIEVNILFIIEAVIEDEF